MPVLVLGGVFVVDELVRVDDFARFFVEGYLPARQQLVPVSRFYL